MSRQITLRKVGGTAPFADGGLKLSKSIQVDKVEPHETFQSLFDIDEQLLERIAESMEKDGFDPSQPIHIWTKTGDDGAPHSYLIDGYTRLAAAKKVGLATVPFYEHKFETVDEAHLYAIHLQVDRRNLTDAELIKNIEVLMGSDYVKNMKGSKSEVIAEVLGVSKRTVDKAINVIKTADDETKEEISSGKKTINKAYKESHKKESKPRKIKDEDDDISDALSEGNSGNPGGLNFSHSDGMEHGPDERFEGALDMDNEADARVAENRRIFLDGKKEGFEKGCGVMANALWERLEKMRDEGMSIEQVLDDDLFSDLSYFVLAEKLGIGFAEE